MNAKSPFDRWFYTAAAAILLVLTFLGFQQFYFQGKAYPGRDIAPPIRNQVIAHALAMTGWVVFFLVQPLLIAIRRPKVHMLLGQIGIFLAATIMMLGFRLATESARITPAEARIWGLPPRQFLAVPIGSIVLFAVFVTLGIVYRFRPKIHRPMMLLATLAAVSAGVSRIDPISVLYHGTVWETIFGPFFATLVLGLAFLIVKQLFARSFDFWFTLGYAGLVTACVGIVQLAQTEAWERIAGILLQ